MKKALVIIGICLLAGYLVFSVFYFQGKPKDGICSKFEVEVKNASDDEQFVDTEDITRYVKEKGLDPTGKQIKDINTNTIEEAILTNQLIKKADVFVTNNGAIKASIEERKPVLRVMSGAGENYYIDNEGRKMPLSRRFTAYLPIATGAIKEDFAKTDLYKFALFLHNDKFWNAQIEQIVVLPNQDIKLIPRVGDHQIILGNLYGYKERLDKLLAFYENGLNETGWNKYSVINLKFDKQVVCTKR
ncbi:cell division protein FtsQ/DivIB [Dysgonomonas termitidis]|uniref:Cell division protein FtsQ/DivIB n=1 Tax=Dysgonomonas termitidis TaxID=1516126 RepID=A0ABV9KT62_9BACT